MKFNEVSVNDAYLIELDLIGDDRGFFARVLCKNEFDKLGLSSQFVQVNSSLSALKGTLRGMHYQLTPSSEVKIVRCIKGSLYDVILDLRPNSNTFGKWFGAELSDKNRKMMYVPEGFAHGFITLEDNTEAFYFVSEFYNPDLERGIRHDDPTFGIEWPIDPIEISEKDRSWPNFNREWHSIDLL
jgi:dTDP-4-dehydrorhamnose 3,5-epimerase